MFIFSVKQAEKPLPSGKFLAHLQLQTHILFHRTFPLGGSLMQPMPDMAAFFKIAQSPAGQKLLAMLKDNPALDLGSIRSAAASGNLEEAKEKLSEVLTSSEVKELLKQLENQL